MFTLYFKVLFMQDQTQPLQTLEDIKQMMAKSSRFISKSLGYSGRVYRTRPGPSSNGFCKSTTYEPLRSVAAAAAVAASFGSAGSAGASSVVGSADPAGERRSSCCRRHIRA